MYFELLIMNKDYKETHRRSQKKYADKHREYYREKSRINNQKLQQNGYHKQKQKEYSKKYPQRIRARNFINNHNLIGDKCFICGDTNNLHFHHTNYKLDIGYTLCRIHHNEIHTK